VQRLFSIFPAGAAGFVLLLIRVGVSATILIVTLAKSTICTHWALVICAVLAFSLCLGVLTPFACVLSCLVELSCICGLSRIDIAYQCFLLLVTASLAVLGPGAYSLDARLFGRRVIQG
jgi:hypothetical protein